MIGLLAQEYHQRGLPLVEIKQLRALSEEDTSRFKRYAQRRLFHEPLAYIAGTTNFFGRDFYVDSRVYVPNPETEGLVRSILEEARQGARVLDVGTGSGNISISLKKERPDLEMIGCDLHPCALEVARSNALHHEVELSFFESCYVDDLPDFQPDIVVSDMPYGDKHYTLPSIDLREFRHMPPQAVFDPRGPLFSYQELIHSILKREWHPLLCIETGRVERDLVEEIIPAGKTWEYICEEMYSITKVQL